ncbi:hypothetical protein B296_00036660 [Ensete ventricosum]|uniref:Uncharacterized protein n=1 Tax=Ensete ventricosum TaxID=4639 RepID=A0A427A207_ENSVE|nr:hypothetical protein B296_00036660 [Ensete ventricosum]
MCLPLNKQLTGAEDDENWSPRFSDRQRSQLEGSSSSHLFTNDAVQHQSPEHHDIGRWWDRRPGPSSFVPQTSFLEPPCYSQQNFNFHSDDTSWRSEAQGANGAKDNSVQKDLHSMSRTRYMDDSDTDDDAFNLHFTDDNDKSFNGKTSYNPNSVPSITIPVTIIPSSKDPVW